MFSYYDYKCLKVFYIPVEKSFAFIPGSLHRNKRIRAVPNAVIFEKKIKTSASSSHHVKFHALYTVESTKIHVCGLLHQTYMRELNRSR